VILSSYLISVVLRGGHAVKIENIPGTTIPYSDTNVAAFSYIKPLILAAGGLSLSQICAITGLESSTIQNWVKRSWIGSVKDKKYSEGQVARILIFNALRGCMQLDNIAKLLRYINGVPMDVSDDIITEGDLFNYLCTSVRSVGYDIEAVPKVLEKVLESYSGTAEATAKLNKALTIMVYASICAELSDKTNLLFKEII